MIPHIWLLKHIFSPDKSTRCKYKYSLTFLETIPKRLNLDSSKLKEFADNNFKFDENCKKLSTEGKGEIARYEHFLPFPQCFQKACTVDT